jgi:hypothetical protein
MRNQIFPLILLLCLPIGSQQVIENSDTPTNKNAGRVVKLEEVLRIEEDGKDIIFSYPYDLQIGPDNGIYFYDSWQLHKFDSKGNFVCKFLKFGQGPGEVERRTRFTFLNNKVIVQAGVPPKIITYDLEGKFLDEIKTEIPRAYTHFICPDGRLMGFQEEIDENVIHKKGYFDMPLNLYEVHLKTNGQKNIYSFPIKYYVKPGMWWEQVVPIFSFKDSDSLFIVYTEEYQIKEISLAENSIKRIIEREYDRVKYVPSERYLKTIARNPDAGPPMREFVQDIRYMTVIDENLWVLTSTKDAEGRFLIDIYDMLGNYIDNFYLDFPDTLAPHRFNMSNIVISSDFVFTVDQGTDDFYSIAKYKIIGD